MNSNDFNRLAELSKLNFTKEEAERMCSELETAILNAELIFKEEGTEPCREPVFENQLRRDEVQPSLKFEEALQNTEGKDNCFKTIRVV